MRGESNKVCEQAEAAIQLSRRHGLSNWRALATALKGKVLCEYNREAEGLVLLDEGIQAYRAGGSAHFTPFLLALKAEACLKMLKLEEGMQAVMSALEIMKRGGDCYWAAELYRLQGELLKAGGAARERVESLFHQAIEIAHSQQARMLELRAAMSLARLWQLQERRQAALQALREVYDGFTEGFDTVELKAAGALLQELS